MLFESLVFQSEMIEKQEAENERREMRIAAFGFWQTGALKRKSFAAYIKELGLVEPEPAMTKREVKAEAKAAMKRGKQILKMLNRDKK